MSVRDTKPALRWLAGMTGALLALGVGASTAQARQSPEEIEKTRKMIYRVSQQEGIDPRILDAIVEIETGYNNNLRGKAGEYGAAQVMPNIWAKEFGIPAHWLADLENNLRAGARVVKRCRKRWRPEFAGLGKVHPGLKKNRVTVTPEVLTAGCYNFGGLPGRVRKTPRKKWKNMSIPKGTLRYMTRFSKKFDSRPPPKGYRPHVASRHGSSTPRATARPASMRGARSRARSAETDNQWTRLVTVREGFVVRNPDRTWGRRYAMDAFGTCAIGTYRAHRRKVAPLVVGDWSHRGGGFMRGHKSHRTGHDVDTSIFVKMSAYRRALYRPKPEDIAIDAQLDFLECLSDTGTLLLVLSDSAIIRRLHARARQRWPIAKVTRVLGKVVHYPNHADHFHYRFRPRNDTGL